MKTNNEKGRSYVILIGAGLLAKEVLGLILGIILVAAAGGGIGGVIGGFIGMLVLDAILIACMFSGLEYMNYGVAGVFGLIALFDLISGFRGFFNIWRPSIFTIFNSLFSLAIAGALVCAILVLVLQKDVKQHFTNKWSDLQNLIQKK